MSVDYFEPTSEKSQKLFSDIRQDTKTIVEILRKVSSNEKDSDYEKIISRNEDGNYLYEKKLIIVAKNTIYYRVFDIMFLDSGQEGFLSYFDIDKKLQQRGEQKIQDKRKRETRIRNAISDTQGFFRFAKIGDETFKNILKDGRKIIEIKRGKGLIFNNQEI